MRVSNRKAKKVALKDMTPKQLREAIRALKREAKGKAYYKREYERVSSQLAGTIRRSNEMYLKLSRAADRARMARKYIDQGTPSPLNAAIAIAEWVAHGPLGDYPERNGGGMHPFKRWNLETPEDREARLEREEQERERRIHEAVYPDVPWKPSVVWHE